MQKRLLFILNEPTYFVSHRLPIAIAARDAGYEVHVATGVRDALPRILEEGFQYHPIPLSRSGRNALIELKSLIAMCRLMTRIQPDIVHLVTIKPVIYGSIAARITKVPSVVAAVSGLGYAFIDQYLEAKLLKKVVSQLYRYAFKHPNLKVIFQNEDDQKTLTAISAIKPEQTILINGSGVDLNHYRHVPEPEDTAPIVVMASRLLRDKGVFEYVEAAKMLRQKGIQARFWLAGQIDKGNPSSVDQKQLAQWVKEGDIEYIGYHADIAELFSQVSLVVLPSYREGLPRVLSEAAACGRAIVTTDVPGCRATILPGETGLLAKVRNVDSLANAMEKLLTDKATRQQMGLAGRQFASQVFNIEHIVDKHLKIYTELR